MSHGKIVCGRCKTVIMQCRCMEGHANISERPGPCEVCRRGQVSTDGETWAYIDEMINGRSPSDWPYFRLEPVST